MEFGKQIINIVNDTIKTIVTLKKTFNLQQQIRQGIRIAILGSVNTGKSSLFNLLIGNNRAIVTPIAGTTRDVIEAGLYKKDIYLTLIDTAGLRKTTNTIEQEGIKRSFEQAKSADIILLVFDGSHPISTAELSVYNQLIKNYKNKIIYIQNKADLPEKDYFKNYFSGKLYIKISTKTNTNIQLLEKQIEHKINTLYQSLESPFLLNQRQYTLILALEKKLNELKIILNNNIIEYELVSYHLTHALSNLSELTGKSISESGMDMVFRSFCVGK